MRLHFGKFPLGLASISFVFPCKGGDEDGNSNVIEWLPCFQPGCSECIRAVVGFSDIFRIVY